jgi:phosphoserine aminotransferase
MPLRYVPVCPHVTGTRREQVLFLQGGASTQFAALPLNFAPEGATVDYVVTGSWGAKCVAAARRLRGLGFC